MSLNIKPKTIRFARTKTGVPALWQSLKEFMTMNRITMIVDSEGLLKDPIYVKHGTNAQSSLIPIMENDFIVKVFNDRDGIGVSILVVTNISQYQNVATVELVERLAPGTKSWIPNPNNLITLTDLAKERIMNLIDDAVENFPNKEF